MTQFFDALESQPAAEREHNLLCRLPMLLQRAVADSRYYQQHFAGIELAAINSRQALTQLPLTRKSDLPQLQQQTPPLAGMVAAARRPARLFQSPGPIAEPEWLSDDWWGMGRAFYAAGFRQGELVLNCLSYHMSPGGFIADSGARACGCTVIPAGPGHTEQQLDIIEQLQPSGYCGTPSFLKILLDKAAEQNRDISSLRRALVTGEAFTPAQQRQFAAADIDCRQAYASADLGLIAYETSANQGLVLNEGLLLEIVHPGSDEPVTPGEIGEVVITRFNHDYPLIRFATGDLSSQLLESSPCGRSNQRLRGWQGRADQSTKVKGLFVHPQQIQRLRQRYPQLLGLRLQVSQQQGQDQMLLLCELADSADISPTQLQQELLRQTKLNGQVRIVAADSLPKDGLVIDDQR